MTTAAVWFLLLWSSGKALPVQLGPFESELNCWSVMSVVQKERRGFDSVSGECVQGVGYVPIGCPDDARFYDCIKERLHAVVERERGRK